MPSIDITVADVGRLLNASDDDTALYVSRLDCIPCIQVDPGAREMPKARIVATRANLLHWYGEEHPDYIIEEYLPELQQSADRIAAALLADSSPRPRVGCTAVVSTTRDIVGGEYCDVMVSENTLHDYWQGEDGPQLRFSLGPVIALRPVATAVRVDDVHDLATVESAAADVLRANGWTATGPWQQVRTSLHVLAERTA